MKQALSKGSSAMDFLAVTPTVAVGKDRVNEYFDVSEGVLTVVETQLGSGKV